MESREKLQKRYAVFIPVYTSILEKIVGSIRALITEKKLSVSVRYRVKDFSSWYAKILRTASSPGKENRTPAVTDILGIRVICPFIEEVKIVSDILEDLFHVQEIDVKGADYPYHHFGYESVHFIIRIPDYCRSDKQVPNNFIQSPVCEVQVRTILQEAWAEVEHELVYKSDFSPLDEPLKRKLAALNANLTLSDIMFQEIRDYQKNLHAALKQRRKTFYHCIREDSPEIIPADIIDIEQDNQTRLFSRETVDSLLLRGLLAHNKGEFSEAVEIYTGILKRNIRKEIRTVIFVHRGMAYFTSGRIDAALEDFNNALELDPGQTKARYYRAVHARINGKYDKAFKDLEICIKAEPYNLEYLTARAETETAAGNRSSALDGCEAVLGIDPDFKPAIRLRKYLKEQPSN